VYNTPETSKELDGLFKQGTDFYEKQDWNNAIKAFQAFIDSSDDPAANVHYMLGSAQYAVGDLNNAKQNLRMCLTYKPDHQEALVNLGLILGKEGNTDEADRLIQKSADLGNTYAKRILAG